MLLNFKTQLIFHGYWATFSINISLSILIFRHLGKGKKYNISNQISPIIFLPDFGELLSFCLDLFGTVFFGCFYLMSLHSHCCCQDLVAELSFPELLVLDHMGVSIADWEVDVEVFYLFWDLFLNASFLLLYPYHVLMGRPVSFDIF